MPDTIVQTIYLVPQLLSMFSILRVDCLHAFTVHPKILSKLLTVCTVVCVVLFITCSLSTPQQNSKAEIDSPHIRFACLVPVAPMYVPPSNDNIYKYMAYVFGFMYFIVHGICFWIYVLHCTTLPYFGPIKLIAVTCGGTPSYIYLHMI